MAPVKPLLSTQQLNEGFEFAHRMCSEGNDRADPGFRVFCVHEKTINSIDIRPGQHVVFGSHQLCNFRLKEEPHIQTRHAIALCTRLADGTPALRLLDLHTSVPFFLTDDEPHQSLVATRDFAARLGSQVIGAFALGEHASTKKNDSSTPDSNSLLNNMRVERSQVVPQGHGDSHHSVLSSLPPAQSIAAYSQQSSSEPSEGNSNANSENAGSADSSDSPPGVNRIRALPRAGHMRLTVRSNSAMASIEFPLPVFDHGVVIGRAAHCEDGGLRHVLTERVSRVHMLLLAENSDIVAYDLCSMNGVALRGTMVQRVVLGHTHETLALGDQLQVEWLFGPTLH